MGRGMFFAYMILRPAAASHLDPPQRLTLWSACFSGYFPWVWGFVLLLPLTGYWIIFKVFGGMASVGMHVHLMQGLGWLMILLFMHLFFAPFKRLKNAVAASDWSSAANHLNLIRRLVGLNLLIGLITIVVAAVGKYI